MDGACRVLRVPRRLGQAARRVHSITRTVVPASTARFPCASPHGGPRPRPSFALSSSPQLPVGTVASPAPASVSVGSAAFTTCRLGEDSRRGRCCNATYQQEGCRGALRRRPRHRWAESRPVQSYGCLTASHRARRCRCRRHEEVLPPPEWKAKGDLGVCAMYSCNLPGKKQSPRPPASALRVSVVDILTRSRRGSCTARARPCLVVWYTQLPTPSCALSVPDPSAAPLRLAWGPEREPSRGDPPSGGWLGAGGNAKVLRLTHLLPRHGTRRDPPRDLGWGWLVGGGGGGRGVDATTGA